MSQFDVHRFAGRRAGIHYVVDLQAQLLEEMGSRLVAPLYPVKIQKNLLPRLNPVVNVGDEPYFIALPEIASMRVKDLGAPVASLKEHRDEIITGVDLLFTGI
jgi:toxin CcdB